MRTIMKTKKTMTTMTTQTNLMVWYASSRDFSISFFLPRYSSSRMIPMKTYHQGDEGLVVEEEGVVVVAHR
jgi:hypothetical protein